MKKVVIITHSKDNISIDKVSNKISDLGGEAIRINTDQYPTQYYLEAEIIDGRYIHHIETPTGQRLSTDDVSSIWYRRFYVGKSIDKTMESQMRSACVEESKRCFMGLLTCSDAFTIDKYWNVRQASIKDWQIKEAVKLGIDVPETLVTNNPKSVQRFYDRLNGKIITKMQTAFAIWEDDREQVVFTNKVLEEHLAELDGLHQCPMVFQEEIDKEVELRATVVGNKLFCAAIDSNMHKAMETDWRKLGAHTLDCWQPYALPKDVEEKMLKLTRAMGLNYGAIDIIVSPKGEYKFLEINPCGEFYWMDHYTNLGICDAMAELLVKQGR